MNHACGGAQTAALRFAARPGRVAVAVVAARDVRRGDEVTVAYATEAGAASEGFASLRAFLRARRLFDCCCATCEARKEALPAKSYPLAVCKGVTL